MGKLQERTNNPMNIRYSIHNNWLGQVGEVQGFCVFSSEAYGIRAAFKNLCTYIRQGTSTVRSIIERWAPPCENSTESYIEYVCREAFVRPLDEMTIDTIDGYWTLLTVMRAMAKIESGKTYEEQTLNLYINYPECFTPDNKINPLKTPKL